MNREKDLSESGKRVRCFGLAADGARSCGGRQKGLRRAAKHLAAGAKNLFVFVPVSVGLQRLILTLIAKIQNFRAKCKNMAKKSISKIKFVGNGKK